MAGVVKMALTPWRRALSYSFTVNLGSGKSYPHWGGGNSARDKRFRCSGRELGSPGWVRAPAGAFTGSLQERAAWAVVVAKSAASPSH